MNPRRLAARYRRRGGRARWIYALVAIAMAAPFAVDAVNAFAQAARGLSATGDACRILTVIDGDTVTLWCEGRSTERARLTGFDAPELFSPGCSAELWAAQRAKWALRGMIFQAGEITIRRQGLDRYGRRLAEVSLDGAPLSRIMQERGLARAYDGGRRPPWCN